MISRNSKDYILERNIYIYHLLQNVANMTLMDRRVSLLSTMINILIYQYRIDLEYSKEIKILLYPIFQSRGPHVIFTLCNFINKFQEI